MTSTSDLSPAMAQTSVVISLLGPDIMQKGLGPKLFSNMYGSTVLPLMREHGVRRIFAMTTLSIKLPEDHWTLIQTLVTNIMWLLLSSKYQAMHNIKDVFVNDAQDIDWTLFRLTGIPGGADEESWRRDRDQGKVFVGYIGLKGWTTSIKRAALARWLVDAAEDGQARWIRKMPAISARA